MKTDRTTLQVRITHPERLRFERRAQSVDLSISEWARLVLRRDCDLWTGETKMTKHTDSSDYETITTVEHEAIKENAMKTSTYTTITTDGRQHPALAAANPTTDDMAKWARSMKAQIKRNLGSGAASKQATYWVDEARRRYRILQEAAVPGMDREWSALAAKAREAQREAENFASPGR